MNRRLLILGLGAALTAARAEIPIDAPIVETATNRLVPGINVPAPLRGNEPTNAAAASPSAASPEDEPSAAGLGRGRPVARVATPAEGDDSLTFINGDRFAGTLLGIEDGVIRWRTPADKEPIRFRADALDELILGTPPRTNAPAPPNWLVLLADGSLLPTRQVTVEGDTVTADFAGADNVRLDRRHVAALRRCGPGACEAVTFGDAPAYGVTNRTMGLRIRYRDTKLPEAVLAEFPWDGDLELPLALGLFVGEAEDLNRPASRLVFSLILGVANLQWIVRDASSGGVTDKGEHALADGLTNFAGRAVWVGLAFNRKNGEGACYVDGQLRGRTALAKPPRFADFGIAVTEVARRRLGPRIVLVSPISENLTLPSLPADRDAVRLVNGDQLDGKLESVHTNEIAFQSAVGRMVLPLERVTQIVFTPVAGAPARAGDTRVALRDGAILRGTWQRTDARTVVVRNSILGPLAFPRSALAEVDCHAAEEIPSVSVSPEGLGKMMEVYDGAAFLFDGNVQSFLWSAMARNPFRYRPGAINLRSGSDRHGDLVAITNNIVRWQHTAALDPMTVPLAEVHQIFPSPRPLPDRPAAELATVRLGNGDVLSGPLGAPAEEKVHVTPWYAGPLAIPRRHVAYVTPHPAVTNAIEMRWAPMGPGQAAPALSDGALWLGSARRPEPLPDRLRLDFEALWLSSGSGVGLTLFEPEHRMNHLDMSVGPAGVTFVKTLGATSRMVDRPPSQDMMHLHRGACVNVSLFADRTNPSLRVLVDGRMAGEWRDAQFPVLAGGMTFGGSGRTGVAVRNVVLREWREGQSAPPVSRSVTVSPLSPGEVRVVFHSGDFLTLGEIAADAQTVTGKHALLGPVTLNLAGVRSLDWERAAAKR
jgi:hypothetical protein